MRPSILTLFLLFIISSGATQNKSGVSFSGQKSVDLGPCTESVSNFMSEKEVNNLVTDMLDRLDIKNRFILVSCTKVENCQATIYKGKPYILYNPNFLDQVKRLNFTNSTIPITSKNWEAITVLAHELGHHVNNHLLNPHPDASQRDMELEADEFAGSMIFRMGGTSDEATFAYGLMPEIGTYEHPGRKQRIEAVLKGWEKAKSRNFVKNENKSIKIPSSNKKNTFYDDFDGEKLIRSTDDSANHFIEEGALHVVNKNSGYYFDVFYPDFTYKLNEFELSRDDNFACSVLLKAEQSFSESQTIGLLFSANERVRNFFFISGNKYQIAQWNILSRKWNILKNWTLLFVDPKNDTAVYEEYDEVYRKRDKQRLSHERLIKRNKFTHIKVEKNNTEFVFYINNRIVSRINSDLFQFGRKFGFSTSILSYGIYDDFLLEVSNSK